MSPERVHFRVSGTDPIPATNYFANSRIVRSLRRGLASSFEIAVLVLLLFLRFTELAFTRCLSALVQFAKPPNAQCSKNSRPQARSEGCRPLGADHDFHESQESPFNTLASRTSSVRSLPLLLPERSTTKEPAPSRTSVTEHNSPGVDDIDEFGIRNVTGDSCLLPVAPSQRSILHREPTIPESTNSPTSAAIPTRPLILGQTVHKRHQATLHHDGGSTLRESASTRQDANAFTAFSTISISHKSIELQPSVVEPSLLQNPLSPPRPAAHIELPRRVVSEHLTHDNPVVRSVENGSPELASSVSYLRTLAKTKGTAGPANATSKRRQSHRSVSSTVPSERTSSTGTSSVRMTPH